MRAGPWEEKEEGGNVEEETRWRYEPLRGLQRIMIPSAWRHGRSAQVLQVSA